MDDIERRYFIQCPECGGTEFKLIQDISPDKDESWEDIIQNKLFCHDGFGWELEDFDTVCTKCNKPVDVKVKHEVTK